MMTYEANIPNREECQTCPLTFAYKEINLLYDIAVMLTSTTEILDSVEKAMRKLKQHGYLERCALFRKKDDADELELLNSIDLEPYQKKMATYRFGEGATGLAAKSREPIVIENIHNNINYLNKMGNISTQMVSYVAVPLLQEDEVIGVISANIGKNSPLNFDEIVRMLTIVGSLFVGALKAQQTMTKEKESLSELKTYYKEELQKDYKFENIVGRSTRMQQVFGMINTVAPTDATILIRGETGTGKELIATAVHNLSRRQNGPFIKLNCAAISETLLESELFGHEKGAFTDAREMRKGRFELADGGTLFLDEIGDITPALQVKLLRILQEQEFERVGGNKTIKTNVRLVAATNRNLEEMVRKGEFREDLFYRLNVIPINLPPLRERYEDVKLLIEHYLHRFMKEHRKTMHFTKEAMELLLDYPWPGNIRELQNTMERIVLICPDGEIQPEMLAHVLPFNYQKLYMQSEPAPTPQPAYISQPAPTPHAEVHSGGPMTKKSLQELERESILQALIDSHGIQTKAARLLGMTARQIGYKIKQYGIEI
ncbi:transcriptional regulator, NifA subfamily, Fis Family [Sulfuricurvum kujiense DSM 16994]|uniref:Nif-specific regulatory protein n=1 Tax=Sulfuricurvum kujiense (strain ATCC BAA-921 / DSM 16994 / JCM 11577 / YK-1) TaxID=709032 RepID=E4TY53_SULKY|nr:nif-specific transcriptional activator NifA [Sulfuricurvum kujiense]ADR33973.1 transcriptional regulator, NifA subfamily, Fis Family [Sulfuricurvum kujiense DSM 16994]